MALAHRARTVYESCRGGGGRNRDRHIAGSGRASAAVDYPCGIKPVGDDLDGVPVIATDGRRIVVEVPGIDSTRLSRNGEGGRIRCARAVIGLIDADLRMGFTEEADAYMQFISDRLRYSRSPEGALPIMFTIRGETDIPEIELE